MKALLDNYCCSMDIPVSNFVRYAVFKEIASQGKEWKDKITWKDL